jgi:hypothetical protein
VDKFKLDQDFDAAKAAALESLPKVLKIKNISH